MKKRAQKNSNASIVQWQYATFFPFYLNPPFGGEATKRNPDKICGYSIMVLCDLPKVETRVRFPLSAPSKQNTRAKIWQNKIKVEDLIIPIHLHMDQSTTQSNTCVACTCPCEEHTEHDHPVEAGQGEETKTCQCGHEHAADGSCDCGCK